MFKERARSLQSVFLVIDTLCIVLAFGIAVVLRLIHPSLPILGEIPSFPWVAEAEARSEYAVLLIANLVAWLAYLRRSGLYRNWGVSGADRVMLVYLKAITLTVLSVGGVVFVLKMSVSRLFFAYFFGSEFVLLLVKHGIVTITLRRIRSSGYYLRHALVVGTARAATWFASIVYSARASGYHLVGVLVTDHFAQPDTGAVRVLGSIVDLDRILVEHPVEEVFIVGSAKEMAELAPVAQDLIEKGRIVSLVSTLSSGSDGVSGRITEFSGVPAISYGPMPRDGVRTGTKRMIDVTVSLLGLVGLAPLLLGIALIIKVGDTGPVLFKQERLGIGGKRFTLFKFRSMRVDAEKILRSNPDLHARYVQNDYKLPEKDDPRISVIGRFLRRTSLDELPQLWNVLRGDMTLVGPRPIVPDEVAEYEPYADILLSVRPGLTGHWQVQGRSDIQYPERAYLDLDYVGRCSVSSDLAIILRTVPAVLKRKGAY